MKRFLKEPLLHFLLLGAAIFAAYSLISSGSSSEPGKIVVTQGHLASMREAFVRTWQRPPTREEWEGLIRDRVREEVYYREALALGLDKDDLIIRRRLRQKMEFITDDAVGQSQPTDDELGAYLKAHPDKFRAQQLLTFRQVYLNPEKRGANLARDAARLLAQLNRAGGQADVSALGDSLLLDHKFDALPASELEKLFGGKFAAKLGELASGQWQGPVESGYGVHLVFVAERTEGRLPALAEMRDAVSREWADARRLEANEKLYAAMLKRYVVTIERPPAAEERR
jgi:hypothetical protein